MADVAEEVVAACCSLVLAAGLEAATILNKRKNESTQHGSNHTSESENHLERATPFCRSCVLVFGGWTPLRDIKVGLMYIANDRQPFGYWTDDMT